jgi:hypothetical protein
MKPTTSTSKERSRQNSAMVDTACPGSTWQCRSSPLGGGLGLRLGDHGGEAPVRRFDLALHLVNAARISGNLLHGDHVQLRLVAVRDAEAAIPDHPCPGALAVSTL